MLRCPTFLFQEPEAEVSPTRDTLNGAMTSIQQSKRSRQKLHSAAAKPSMTRLLKRWSAEWQMRTHLREPRQSLAFTTTPATFSMA